MTIIAVLIMGTMAHYANNLMTTTQSVFSEQLLPIEKSRRELSQAALLLFQRQQQFLDASSTSELSQFADKSVIQQDFESNWQQLATLFAEEEGATLLLKNVHELFLAYIELDSDLFTLRQERIELDIQVIDKQASYEQLSQSLVNIVQDLNKRLNSEGLNNVILKFTSILEDISELRLLNYKLFPQTNDLATFVSMKQIFDDVFLSAEANVARLHSESFRLDYVNNSLDSIKNQLEALRILMDGSNGIFAIEKRIHENQNRLLMKKKQALIEMSQLSTSLNQLSQDLNRDSYQSVINDAQHADRSWWQIVTLLIVIMLSVLIFAYLLFNKITHPITSIKDSMKALSEGRFETRMTITDSQNEISLLARDFNHFSEVTQKLIADYSKAKVTLQHGKQQLSALLNGVPEAILSLNQLGEIIDINSAGESILRGSKQQLEGVHLFHFLNTENYHIDSMDELEFNGDGQGEYEGQRYDGTDFSLWLSLNRINNGNNEIMWVCVIADITKWKQTNQQLKQMTAELNTILENAMVGIAFIKNRHIIRVNKKFEELFQVKRDEIEGEKTRFIYPSDSAFEQFGEHAAQYISVGDSYEAELELVRKNGERFWCALAGKPIDAEGPEDGSIWLFEDITAQRENEDRLTKLASIDSLTGLPNRGVFNDRLEHALHKAERNQGRVAVCFIDLDHFKHINDSLGHKAGDYLLKEVAKRIKSTIREGDTVARLGGDEFTVILEEVKSAEYVGKVVEKIIHAMAQPYFIDTTEVNVSPSIGISLYPADGRDIDLLIRNADAAMYHAKKLGRNNFQFYSHDMNSQASLRLAMETALRKAVEHEEFFLHFQPQITIASGQMSGAEVLLRWNSSQWGMVSPAEFVPILEDTGMISVVGEWVLKESCKTFLKYQHLLSEDFKIAVNLSGRQFKGGQLASRVNTILKETNMPPEHLELEITESMLMEDPALATQSLAELSDMGISLAIDDFGTGYSSLSYLKQFPLNVLKIDSSFIRDITIDRDDAAIVEAIMAMSDSLGLEVVAEGVETTEQLDFLKRYACDYAQGYLLSKPVDEQAFAELANKDRFISNDR